MDIISYLEFIGNINIASLTLDFHFRFQQNNCSKTEVKVVEASGNGKV